MIRKATENDIETLVDMGKAFHGESPRYGVLPLNEDHARAFIRDVLAHDDTHVILVSEIDGAINGMLGASVLPFMFNFDTLYSSDFGFYVTPEARRTGAAARLIKAYEKWALECGVAARDITLGVSAGINQNGVYEFLEKMGYTRMGISFRKGE